MATKINTNFHLINSK